MAEENAIRALVHPLRLDLLETLARLGPATAAECGRALGVPQANCSFHLRQLARFGLVEPAADGGDRRERRWRVVADRPVLRVRADTDPVVARELERLVVEREVRALLDHLDRRDADDPAWRAATGPVAGIVALDDAEAAELKRAWVALLAPYAARLGQPLRPGQRHVRYFLSATPGGDQP